MCCSDLIDMKVTVDAQLRRCTDNRSVWLDMVSSPADAPTPADPLSTASPPSCQATKSSPAVATPMPTMTFNCVADSLIWVSRGRDPRLLSSDVLRSCSSLNSADRVWIQGLPDSLKRADHIQVLCTGSLHLVGDILGLLDPVVCDKQ